MATITPTAVFDSEGLPVYGLTVTWADMNNGDVGAPISTYIWEKQFIQGASSNATLQISNDGTTWIDGLNINSAVLEVVERPKFIRPVKTTSGTATVTLFCSRRLRAE